MSDQAQRPAKIETLLNSPKLKLSAMNPTNKKWANLSLDLFRGNPRIVVNSNDDNLRNEADGWGKVTAAMDVQLMGMVILMVEDAIAAPGEYKAQLENSNHSYAGGQRSQDITPQNSVWVGKDANGQVYISVVSVNPKFPKIKFLFGPSDSRYFKLRHADGTEYTRAEISVLGARAWVMLLKVALPYLSALHYEPAPKPTGGFGNKGGGGGGYGGNRGGGGGYGGNRGGGGGYGGGQQNREAPAKPAAGFDEAGDDIPF